MAWNRANDGTDANPTIARLRAIRELVSALALDDASADYWRSTKAMRLLDEAIRVAKRKHHLVRKLHQALRAKDRRMRRYHVRRAAE